MNSAPGYSSPSDLVLYDACPLCESRAIVSDREGNCSAHPLFRPELSAAMYWVRCSVCVSARETDPCYSLRRNKVSRRSAWICVGAMSTR